MGRIGTMKPIPLHPPSVHIDDDELDFDSSKGPSYCVAFLEIILGLCCFLLTVYVMFFDRNGLIGTGSFRDPFVMSFNSTGTGFPYSTASFLSNLSKVSVAIEHSIEDALWMRMNYSLVHMYVITAACLLLGMSTMALRGFKGTSALAKSLALRNSWYPIAQGKGMILEYGQDTKEGESSPSTKPLLSIIKREVLKRRPIEESDCDLTGTSSPCFVALSEFMLGIMCLTISLWVIFFDQDSDCFLRRNPIVASFNADGFPDKVTLTINYASTWLGMSNTLIHLYVVASACLLLGMSLLVMRCWKSLSEFTKVVTDHRKGEGFMHPSELAELVARRARRNNEPALFQEEKSEDFYKSYCLLPPLPDPRGDERA